MKKTKSSKIKNLRLANCIMNGGFHFDVDGLTDKNNNLLIVGGVNYWDLVNNSDIEYYQFKNKDGKIRSMETIAMAATDYCVATEQEKDNKFKWVYIFGTIANELFMLGRLKQEDEYNKHILRVFRGFWANGAGILNANS